MIVVLVLIATIIFLNYFLGYKLYKEPKKDEFFHNVKNINTIKMPEIAPDPQYILLITILSGVLIGLFISFTEKINQSSFYSFVFTITIGILYLIEISRRVRLTDESLSLSRLFAKTKEIPLNDINGMYIFSPNKKFMNGHSFTTKLVVCTHNNNIRFTISSLNKKAIINMMKNNFGISDYKIFVANNK